MLTRVARHTTRRPACAPFRLCGEELESRRLLAFDPSGMEQAYLEDINRMRIDPQGELNVLFSSLTPLRARDPRVQSAMDFFNVNGNLLLSQWSQLTAVSPLAWNEDLYDAAGKHNTQMQLQDRQEHQLPGEPNLGDRVSAEGYQFRRLNENIFAFAEDHIHGHAGFVIDWGEEPGGIQDPPGHRDSIMDGRLTDVGIAVLADINPSNQVGPFLVTQDFGQPRNAGDPFMLGVTWRDTNSNGIYDPTEGIADVNIRVSGPNGTFTTQSMSAGGYQVRVPDGVYQVMASGGTFGAGRVISSITVSGSHRKVDFQPTTGNVAPIANPDAFSTSENIAASYNVMANDRYPDGTGVSGTVNISTQPQSGTITNILAGRVTYQPNPGFAGTDSFRYFVRDNLGITSNIATVTISVAQVNDAPTAQSFSVTMNQDTVLTIPMSSRVTDGDGSINWNTLEVSGLTLGSAEIDSAARTIRYTPPEGYSGITQFEYRVADNESAFSPLATITVTVHDVNDPPVAVSDTFATITGQGRVLPVVTNDTDRDGDIGNARVIIAAIPSWGQAIAVSNTVQYTPAPDFVGADTFSYYVVDPAGATSNTATVTVYVTPPDNRWQNPVNSRDVNGDHSVAALDVLQVINRVGTNLANPGPGDPTAPPPFVDVNGDGNVAPIDAILVINQLISNGQNAAASTRFPLEVDVETVSGRVIHPANDWVTSNEPSLSRIGDDVDRPYSVRFFLQSTFGSHRAGRDVDESDHPFSRFRLAAAVFADFVEEIQ
jgi:hypothetical protein